MTDSVPSTSIGSRAALSRWIERFAMREREVRDTLWLILAILWVLAPFPAILPIWCSLTVAALLIWRSILTCGGRRPPPRAFLLGLMLLAGIAIYLQYRTLFGKDAGVAFVILLLGLKLLELRARRDILVVIFLCLFIMLTNLFESQSIPTAIWLLIGVLLLVTAMLRVNFVGREPSFQTKLRLAIQISAWALPLMVVMFLLFPRVEGPLWGMPADAFARRTGLSDSMSPGSFEHMVQSDETAFEAQFATRIPTPVQRYWRGPVFGFFDGRTWRATSTSDLWEEAPEIEGDAPSRLAYTITLEPNNRHELYLLDAPAAAPEVPGTHATVRSDLQVTTQGPMRERVRFHAASYTRYRYGVHADAAQLRPWLELPQGYDPRTLEFARRLRADASDPHVLIARVLSFFRTQNFYYTPDPPALGRNSIDEFLFQTRRGFCEHYAGAFVFLMRALAIPARVVTGYQGGDFNPVNRYLTVRQRDAHAWAEVWIKDEGWVRVDPTAAVAPERIERGSDQVLALDQGYGSFFGRSASGWLTSLRQHFEAVGNGWNQWIISYTGDEQSSLFSGFGIPSVNWQTLTVALITAFCAILAAVAGKVILNRPRRDPIEISYSKLCARLQKFGPARQPFEGPDDYRVRILPRLPESHRTLAARAFALYEGLRYAPPTALYPKTLKEFRACVTALRL